MRTSIKYGVASASAFLGLLFGQSPVAQAGQFDYVRALDDNGVAYASILGVLDLGKQVCHHMRDGGHFGDAMSALVYEMDYSVREGAIIISWAVAFMCPDAGAALDRQLNETETSQTA